MDNILKSTLSGLTNEQMKTLNFMKNAINGKSNNFSVKKIKLKRYKNFYFIDDKISEAESNNRDRLIKFLETDIPSFYLTKIDAFKVDDSLWYLRSIDETNNLEINSQRIVDLLRSIRNNFEDKVINGFFKIYSDNYSAYFHIHDRIVNEKLETNFMIIRFDGKHKVCIIDVLAVINDGNPEIRGYYSNPLYISTKDMNVEQLVNSELGYLSRDLLSIIDITYESLSIICNNTDYMTNINESDIYDHPEHSKIEISIINKLISSRGEEESDEKYFKYNIRSLTLDKDNEENPFTEYFDSLGYNEVLLKNNECPLVDFTEKEWKFIKKYIEEKGLGENNFNILEILETPRYGIEMKFPSIFDDEILFNVSYQLNKNLNSVRFNILYSANDKIDIVISIDFENLSDFNVIKSIISIDINAFFKGELSIRNLDELKSMIPLELSDMESLLSQLIYIIGTYVVLYDRPQRSRVIRETTKVSQVINKTNKKKEGRKNKTEENYIIRRILKGTKEAKEYISKMSTTEGSNREYTLEEWERIGYWRKKPNSTEKIWIEPTKCHRHLPLSDKELHIRL